jgi:hypothetical protein
MNRRRNRKKRGKETEDQKKGSGKGEKVREYRRR